MSSAHELAQTVREALLPVRPDDPLTGRLSNAMAALAELKRLAADAERYREALRDLHAAVWNEGSFPADHPAMTDRPRGAMAGG